MSVVRDKNVTFKIIGFFSIDPIQVERLIACARSCTLTTTTSLVETTTAGSGKGATFKPQKNITTGSIEGVVFLNETSKITLSLLRQMQLNHTEMRGEYERTADDGSTYTDVIFFYMTSITDTGSVGDFNTFQIDIQVNGDPVIVTSTSSDTDARQVEWMYAAVEPVISDLLLFTHTQNHIGFQDIEISVSDMAADRWIVVRYPSDETDPVAWYNTPLNNGTIPDFVFEAIVTLGDWKYIKSRNAITLDKTQPLKFTH